LTLDACARLVERGDPDRFRVAMAAPPEARGALFPLYAFNLEVARAPWMTREPLIAEMRLQWWRDVISEAHAGAKPLAHEVAGPLAALIQARGLDPAPLDALVEARRRDIPADPFTAAEIEAYLAGTAGNLMRASVAALGPDDAEAAAKAGFAGGVAAWLLALPALAATGRGLVDDRPEAVGDLAEKGLAALVQARRTRFRTAIPALRAASFAVPVLRLAARDPAAAAQGRLAPSDAGKRLRLLWLALRGAW